MNRNTIFFLIRLTLGFSLIILLFFYISPLAVLQSLQSVNPVYLAAAILVYACALLILTIRWKLILRHLGTDVPLMEAYQAFTAGVLYSDFTPGRIGDLTRAALVKKWLPLPKATISVIVDRYIDIIVLTLLGITAVLLFSARFSASAYPLAGLVVLGILLAGTTLLFLKGALVFSLFQRIPSHSLQEIFRSLELSLKEFGRGKTVIAQGIILTVSAWGAHTLRVLLLAMGMGFILPFPDLFVLLPLISALSLVPVSLAGLGLVEGGMTAVITGYGVPLSVAFSIAVLDRGITMLFHFVVGWKYGSEKII